MKGEIPVCARCCFCLPLRYGLIAWGYFKLIVAALLIFALSYTLLYTIAMYRTSGNNESWISSPQIIIPSLSLTLFVIDLVMTIVFIVGGHKKNVKLIRVFYFFAIVMWTLTILVTATLLYTAIASRSWSLQDMTWSIMIMLLNFSIFFIAIVVQTYFLLLLRSEIMKLRSNCEFRFVNNAVEAECNMTMKHGGEVKDDETDTEED